MKNIQPAKLEISFPKSSEDRRLQLVAINGAVFAIIHSPLESDGPIQLYCDAWSLIILAPIKTKSNIVISAINVICLNEIESLEGIVNIHASNRLVKFAHMLKPAEKVDAIVEGKEFQFEDDPGALLHYHRLFKNILKIVSEENLEAFPEAQQMFIMSLCTLADKIEKTKENLDLHKVLEIWNIQASKPLENDAQS